MEGIKTLLKIRVVATFNAGNKEICADLPTLHSSHWEIVGWQPGNPGSSALGSFTIPLFPPGTEQYKAAKPYYDALDYFQRVEAYSGGKLMFSGIITDIRRTYGENALFELSGHSDTVLANLSRPFQGETLSLNYGSGSTVTASYRQARNHFGTNELGWADNFNPFTAGNYTSTKLPGGATTAGTWTGTTDNGLNVVSCSTGNAAVLLSKTGAGAQDAGNLQYVELSGRLKPSSDTSDAGLIGVGLSEANTDCNNSFVAFFFATWNTTTSNWDLTAKMRTYVAGTPSDAVFTNALTSVGDPEGYIPFVVSIYDPNSTGVNFTINGKQFNLTTFGLNFASATAYPFILFGIPNTGSATAYATNLIQMVRYADDKNPGTAVFKSGTIGTPAHSLAPLTDSSPTFLEVWSRVATLEGWYWRYTPQPYVVGTRTLGTVDLTTDPGTDLGSNQTIVFSENLGNLISVGLTANADSFATGTIVSGVSGSSGGGLALWRDVPSMVKYGVIDDQTLGLAAANFIEQHPTSFQVVSNKINVGPAGSKTIKVLRDPQTADKWRELDRVMLHCPELGLNCVVARVIGYTFDENSPFQTLTLDQFSIDDLTLLQKRFQQGLFQTTAKFGNR